MKNLQEIDYKELKKINKRSILIIDVREPNEFEASHIPNSINIPRKLLLKTPEEFLNEKAYIVCQNGKRSKKVAKKLHRKGFDVCNVTGGTYLYGKNYALVRYQKASTKK